MALNNNNANNPWEYSVLRGLPVHPRILNSRTALTMVVIKIEDYCRVVPILKKGQNAVTLTIVIRFGRNSALDMTAME